MTSGAGQAGQPGPGAAGSGSAAEEPELAGEPELDCGSLPAAVRGTAQQLFGDELALAERYAALLATEGVVRGLIGPREAPRIWQRHLLNCAVIQELIPPRAEAVDVGSGAGLPGVVLGIARPDLTVTLVEATVRRTAFLEEVVAELRLGGRVTVVRGRAEEVAPRLRPAEVVTARALAPLDRLAQWCLPLAAVGGRVLAVKGRSAAEEVERYAAAVRRWGGENPVIRQCGVGLVDPPTTVVEIVRRAGANRAPDRRRRRG